MARQQQYTIVTLINADKTAEIIDAFDGAKYKVPPRSKLMIPEFIAQHWLGNVYAPPEFWASEVSRVSNRNPKMLELLVAGDIYVKEWKDANLTRSYSIDVTESTEPSASTIVATPLEESDDVPTVKGKNKKEFAITGAAAELAPM